MIQTVVDKRVNNIYKVKSQTRQKSQYYLQGWLMNKTKEINTIYKVVS